MNQCIKAASVLFVAGCIGAVNGGPDYHLMFLAAIVLCGLSGIEEKLTVIDKTIGGGYQPKGSTNNSEPPGDD